MTPALDLLKKVRAEHRIHSYEHDPKASSYGLEAAEKLGLDPAQVFKTLLASSEKGELLVAVVPVVGSLDLKALAHAAGVKKVEMADPAAAQRSTGYLLGGISPLGQKKRLRTFIDTTAQPFATIFVSAGRRGLEVELSAAVLADNSSSPLRARSRLPSTLSRIHLSLVPEKYGSVTRPVVSLMYCSWPSRLSCWQISVLRRHCQTMAL